MSVVAKNRNVLLAGLIVAALMAMFPPWTYTYVPESTHVTRHGYAPLWSSSEPDVTWSPSVDFSRLALQWVIVGAAVGGVVLLRSRGRGE